MVATDKASGVHIPWVANVILDCLGCCLSPLPFPIHKERLFWALWPCRCRRAAWGNSKALSHPKMAQVYTIYRQCQEAFPTYCIFAAREVSTNILKKISIVGTTTFSQTGKMVRTRNLPTRPLEAWKTSRFTPLPSTKKKAIFMAMEGVLYSRCSP